MEVYLEHEYLLLCEVYNTADRASCEMAAYFRVCVCMTTYNCFSKELQVRNIYMAGLAVGEGLWEVRLGGCAECPMPVATLGLCNKL